MQAQGGTNHDNRTTGVVDALTQQVLTETTLLTFDHVSKRFQRTLVRTGNSATATTVIEQGINRLLQHALFVAHDNIRRIQVQQALQTVITVNNAAIQIVQIRGRKTAAIQRYQRTQIRWQNRQNLQDHPLWLVARICQRFDQLQALRQFFDFCLGVRRGNLFTQTLDFLMHIQLDEQVHDRLGTHFRGEVITELFHGLEVLLIAKQLPLVQGSHPGVGNNVRFEVENPLDVTQGHVQQQADAAWQ